MRAVSGIRLLFGHFLAATLFAAALCAQGDTSTYRVGPRDLLEIKVFEVPELNVERRIGESGALELPLVGPVAVTGLAVEEVRDKLKAILEAKYVRRASVSVVVKEFQNQPISVIGAIARPGPLSSSGRWTLLQAISEAGGLTSAAGKRIYVLRHADNGLSGRLEVSTDDLLTRSDPRWNVPIYPNDVINVPAQVLVRIFVLGEVRIPGAVEMSSDDRITLLSVLAKAGGLTDRASRGTVRIKRRGAGGKDVELSVPYRRILSGKEPDPVLSPNDVVIVKESVL
jgi:polysaccharide export outer membrane protein